MQIRTVHGIFSAWHFLIFSWFIFFLFFFLLTSSYVFYLFLFPSVFFLLAWSSFMRRICCFLRLVNEFFIKRIVYQQARPATFLSPPSLIIMFLSFLFISPPVHCHWHDLIDFPPLLLFLSFPLSSFPFVFLSMFSHLILIPNFINIIPNHPYPSSVLFPHNTDPRHYYYYFHHHRRRHYNLYIHSFIYYYHCIVSLIRSISIYLRIPTPSPFLLFSLFFLPW